MNHFFKPFLSFFFLFIGCFSFSFSAQAAHLVGGDITYTCNGGNNYTVTLTVYRDCSSVGADFDASAVLKVYHPTTHVELFSFAEPYISDEQLDLSLDDPCINLPTGLCIEKAIYEYDITLPASLTGYLLNYQRCCYVNNVNNLSDSGSDGMNVTALIPGAGTSPCYSSPTFNEDPPLTFCEYTETESDFGVTAQTNVGSIIYTYVNPTEGASQLNPTGFNNPPFTNVNWETGYSAANPIQSDPSLSYNATSGLLTGVITQTGYYLMETRAEVIDDGEVVAYISRIFRYIVSDCSVSYADINIETEPECGEFEVNFINGSTEAGAYFWNFDDPASGSANTSTQFEPTHTFTGSGNYSIQLIAANANDVSCSDTAYFDLEIGLGPDVSISTPEDSQCFVGHNFDFESTSTIPDDQQTYTWNFGPLANPSTSSDPNPTGITFQQGGSYTVSLTTVYEECESNVAIDVFVFNQLDVSIPNAVQCNDLVVNFSNNSTGVDNFSWNFGDNNSGANNTSTQASPSHTFSDYGNYTVEFSASSGDGLCVETVTIDITVLEGAVSTAFVNNDNQCFATNKFVFSADTDVEDFVNAPITYFWNFGPDATPQSSTDKFPPPVHFNSIGNHEVILETTTNGDCSTLDTITVTTYVLEGEITGDKEGCAPYTATFTPGNINPDYSYSWKIQGQIYNQQTITYTFQKAGFYDIKLVIEEFDTGCKSILTEEDFIEIYADPEPEFTISDEYVTIQQSVTITSTVTNPDYETSFSIPKYGETTTDDAFKYIFYEVGDYEITQTVVNGPCETELTKIVHVGPTRIHPPNVFTPNGDFTNDFYFFTTHYHENVELQILDRWGKELFHSYQYEKCNNLKSPYCWDGTDKNGNNVSAGEYIYLIHLEDGQVEKGFITLIR
ncbi:MAG: PKD domain-containing protein [Flavobacteriales bacterium]